MKFVRVLLLCLVCWLDKDSSSLLVHASNCTSIAMSNSELAISRQICLCSSTFSREKLLLQYPLLLTFKLHPQPFARNDCTFWHSLTSHSLHCISGSNSILVSGISALVRSWNRLVLPTANYPRMFQEGSMCSEYDPFLNFVFQSFSFFGISELWKGCPLVVGYRACVLAIYYLRRLALLFISQIINKQEMKQIDVTFWQVLKIGSKNKGSYNFH